MFSLARLSRESTKVASGRGYVSVYRINDLAGGILSRNVIFFENFY